MSTEAKRDSILADASQSKIEQGSIVMDDEGQLVLLLQLNSTSEEAKRSGQVAIEHVGVILNTSKNGFALSQWRKSSKAALRRVTDYRFLVHLLKGHFDISTPAEKSDEQLTEIEKLQRDNERLRQRVEALEKKQS